MNMNIVNGAPVVHARTPSVIPTGKFQGNLIADLGTDDLRSLQQEFFRRDPAVQYAITQELYRRRRGHSAPRAARG